MSSLLSLPDELLILICQHLTIPTIFTIRLVHSHLAALVLEHSQVIAPSVATTTFPDAQLLLRVPSGQRRDFAWLKSLVYKYLAAVLVDRFKLSSTKIFFEPLYILAESEMGDALRARVENGWRIFKKLGEVTKEAGNLPDMQLAPVPFKDRIRHRAISQRRYDALARKKALESLEHQLKHQVKQDLNSLPEGRAGLRDYALTACLVHAAFRTKHDQPEARLLSTHRRPPFEGPDDFDWDVKNGITLENNTNSWVNWAILQLGPLAFFQQWSPTSDKSPCLIKERLVQMWEKTTPEAAKAQRHIAVVITGALREIGVSDPLSMGFHDQWIDYKRWEMGLGRFHTGAPLPHDWMEGIPYFIDFKSGSHKYDDSTSIERAR